jgi:malonyl-CoA decarboxylase
LLAEELKKTLPSIATFSTLSPVPGFGLWLDKELQFTESAVFSLEDRENVATLEEEKCYENAAAHIENLREPLLKAASHYFLRAKAPNKRPLDPVARFHLSNGARHKLLNLLGDVSSQGVKQSNGLLVNYLHDLDEVERNYELYASNGTVVASPIIHWTLVNAA